MHARTVLSRVAGTVVRGPAIVGLDVNVRPRAQQLLDHAGVACRRRPVQSRVAKPAVRRCGDVNAMGQGALDPR